MKYTTVFLLLAGSFTLTSTATAQVFRLGELNTSDFKALDRERTAIFMSVGVIEEHGPYLPILTDSYVSDWLVSKVANAIVAREGWSSVILPSLPIGVGAPEDFGPRVRDFGSLPLRPETKRAVLMDLVSGLGEAGFHWIFAIDIHGPYVNKRMTDEAADYFRDVYGGTMVNLAGVRHPEPPASAIPLSDEEDRENGLAVHAGLGESSWVMYVRPDLIGPGRRDAVPITANSWGDYATLPNEPDWPGYFGSPRLARADIGADRLEARAANLSDLALRIIDGLDPSTLSRAADGQNPAIQRLDGLILEHATRIKDQQANWMRDNQID